MEPSYGKMNYPDNDLEGVRSTMNKQGRLSHNLKQIPCSVSAMLEYTPQQPLPQ